MNLTKFCFVLETKCQTIKIHLKNDVLVHQRAFEGTYEMSAPINGHPSWISFTNAPLFKVNLEFRILGVTWKMKYQFVLETGN